MEVVGRQDGLGDPALGSPPLPALSLDGEIGVFFADAEIPPQDGFGAIDDLARAVIVIGETVRLRSVDWLDPSSLSPEVLENV